MPRSIGATIAALGPAQIIGWGTTHYMPAVLSGSVAAGLGISPTLVLGGFSWGLLVAGLSARASGRLMDRFGARSVMTGASLLVALGLGLLALANDWPMIFAGWTLIGLAMRSILYDGAFAALAILAGDGARRAISLLTLFGGFASTVFWPIGAWLDATAGWRITLLVYALLNAVPCALLHWYFAGGSMTARVARMPRASDSAASATIATAATAHAGEAAPPSQIAIRPSGSSATPLGLPPTGADTHRALLLASTGFTLYAIVQSAMSAHLIALLVGLGFGAAVVVSAASLMGVAQVAARIAEMSLQSRFSALAVSVPSVALLPLAFALALLLPASAWAAVIFVAVYGCGNGLMTIVRGSLPLAVFGGAGYGEMLGRLAGPGFVAAAAAPVAFAAVIERAGGTAALWLLGACALGSLAAIATLVRRAARARHPA